MNRDILNTGVQQFISDNLNTDIVSFLLKKAYFETVSNKEVAEQIESKKKCLKKLPKWFQTPLTYYPKKLSIEQTSSEETACYKSQIVSGKTLVDLTGGLGVDSSYFSHKIAQVFHCEIDAELAQIAAHNFKVFGLENIETFATDGIRFLKSSKQAFDWVFIDPSRRSLKKGKVFNFSDCIPNIEGNFQLFFNKADNVLIKTAPFLDISMGLKSLQNVKELHIIAVKNEVKELLWVLKKEFQGEIKVKTVNLDKGNEQTFDFMIQEEEKANSSFAFPLTYLYEPNAAILKAGAFKLVGSRYSLVKIHKHTHLYTSDKLLNFPGRRFLIIECLLYNKRAHALLKNQKANVATRNFPRTVAEIKEKHRIQDGGETYLFFVKDVHARLVVLKCKKII